MGKYNLNCPNCNGELTFPLSSPEILSCTKCYTSFMRNYVMGYWRGFKAASAFCEHCMYSLNHEDEDKWGDPIACGACGRTKEELIKFQEILDED